MEEEFIEDVKAAMEKYNNVVIAVSEGIKDANGKYVSATTAVEDTFGHSQLSGTGKCLEYIIKQNIQVKVRSVEINILQRSAAHMSSITDIGEAFRLGRHAINISIEGKQVLWLQPLERQTIHIVLQCLTHLYRMLQVL